MLNVEVDQVGINWLINLLLSIFLVRLCKTTKTFKQSKKHVKIKDKVNLKYSVFNKLLTV